LSYFVRSSDGSAASAQPTARKDNQGSVFPEADRCEKSLPGFPKPSGRLSD
jgi:hypothetical protein